MEDFPLQSVAPRQGNYLGLFAFSAGLNDTETPIEKWVNTVDDALEKWQDFIKQVL